MLHHCTWMERRENADFPRLRVRLKSFLKGSNISNAHISVHSENQTVRIVGGGGREESCVFEWASVNYWSFPR